MPLADKIKQMWKQENVIVLLIITGATNEIQDSLLLQNLETLRLYQELYLYTNEKSSVIRRMYVISNQSQIL